MIIFDHVSKVYPNGTVGLDDVNLTIQDGEFVAIIGRSGAGKSTLLRSVNRMHQITAGTLAVNGTDVSTLSGKSLRRFRRGIGMVFQSFNLVTRTTVIKNVLSACVPDMPFWRVLLGTFRKEDKIKALESLDKVGILDKAYMRADQLSGGQQQRVALARALVIKPDVLLMDEPLSNLDAKLRVEMRTVIKEIQHTVGITNVYVTHDQEEAMAVSDRIAVINKGDIQQVGTPKDIYQRPANLFVATFIGRSNVLDGELRMENGKPVLHFHAGASITLDNVRAEECKNQPVKISVRPEEFILDASTDATGLKATVDSSVFLGLNTHYFAHTDDGDKIEIIQESQIDSIIPDGTVVRLGVKTEKINVFDAEGKQNLLEGVRNDNAV